MRNFIGKEQKTYTVKIFDLDSVEECYEIVDAELEEAFYDYVGKVNQILYKTDSGNCISETGSRELHTL